MTEIVEKKKREFPAPVTGHGPGPYLFGGEKGLEEALDAAERGENWLEQFTAGKISLTG